MSVKNKIYKQLQTVPINKDLLVTSCLFGFLDIVKVLVEKIKIDINVIGSSGYTPLLNAVKTRNLKLIKFLISKGCDVNGRGSLYSGDSPLTLACDLGFLDVVKLLISCGADYYYGNYSNQTPIKIAVQNKNYNLVSYLVDNGLYNINDVNSDDDYLTLLELAILKDHVGIVSKLLTIKNINIFNENYSLLSHTNNTRIATKLINLGAYKYINKIDIYGCSPIDYAIFCGDFNLIKLYLRYVSKEELNRKRDSLIIQQIIDSHVATEQQKKIINLLVKNGLSLETENSEGDTIFYECHDYDMLKYLLKLKRRTCYVDISSIVSSLDIHIGRKLSLLKSYIKEVKTFLLNNINIPKELIELITEY